MAPTLSLPAELSIYTVGELRPQWLAWLALLATPDAPVEVSIDGSAVDQIDAAGVQLLAALSRSLAALQRAWCLIDASPVLSSACATLGLPVCDCGAEAEGASA